MISGIIPPLWILIIIVLGVDPSEKYDWNTCSLETHVPLVSEFFQVSLERNVRWSLAQNVLSEYPLGSCRAYTSYVYNVVYEDVNNAVLVSVDLCTRFATVWFAHQDMQGEQAAPQSLNVAIRYEHGSNIGVKTFVPWWTSRCSARMVVMLECWFVLMHNYRTMWIRSMVWNVLLREYHLPVERIWLSCCSHVPSCPKEVSSSSFAPW